MVVNRPALWVLLLACSLAGGVYALSSEIRAPRRGQPRPTHERYVFGILTGVGMGMGVATLVLLAAALIVRLSPDGNRRQLLAPRQLGREVKQRSSSCGSGRRATTPDRRATLARRRAPGANGTP
jgi:hypothetical protein